ncbi:tRNA guanosine(34) transglycosylase Tgt [Chitinophaga alhagiae]|uniref:tRNA guanosine(34) transglycosylase Tgt n=1 Tax=Chitinophaga alhagiae TaxID=2203219 RepID=UPI000E5C4B4E|nr:tRNA guanosine(34) transglycosylase Tgt [Chitinophaga alhagiae]
MQFDLITTDGSGARAGLITTDHGSIETPIFMPVGTVGSVKAVTQEQLRQEVNAQIILGNTYHLYLRPGMEVMRQAGGLHQFNGWERPVLTDSGGYQVFSLAANRKIKEEGVVFQSHIDGSRHLFTPENVMDIQRGIGADIIMAFDECPPYPSEYRYAKRSMELTHRWLDRCIQRLGETAPEYGHEQTLFPIVQGSTYKDLRKASAEAIASRNCAGNAIGGLSVGEPEAEMYDMCGLVTDILPKEKPRYLMGVGTPWNILNNIELGIDMFDCVMPTRNGRNGMLFTWQGVVNIRNKKWATDFSPVDPETPCTASQQYSRAYLRHLFVAGEILGMTLASIHNLCFYLELVRAARVQILQGTFGAWKKEMLPRLQTRL